MSEPDPSREISKSGPSEASTHSGNVFGAPAGGVFGGGPGGPVSSVPLKKLSVATRPAPSEKPAVMSHHPTPVFAAGLVSSDWVAILDSLPYGFALLGPKQELRHENAACRQITGEGIASRGGVEGWLSALCPDPGHREKVIKSWREEIWRNQRTRTFTLTSPGQKPREIQFRSSLLEDGGITLSIEDVTETLRAEETQRHGKWKYRALFTHTRTGAVLVDHLGRITEVNPAFISLCGISLKDLRLTPFASLLHPDEAGELAAAEKALLSCAEDRRLPADLPLSREIWLRTHSGEKRVNLLWSPVSESNDPPALSLYLVEPLGLSESTDQLRAKLRALSRKAQALLHAVPDLILLLDGDGKVVDFAPPPKAWPELTPDDSWRQRPVSELWPALGNLLNQARTQIIEEGRTIYAEIRGSADEGYEFAISLNPCGEDQILAVVRNQSALRALRDRDLWQGAAFTHSPVGILRLDPRGLVADSNAAAASLFGEEEAVLAGTEFNEFSLPSGVTSEFLALEHEGKPRGSLVFVQSANQGPPNAPPAAVSPSEATATPQRERRQHSFRNQLQLVTSLFSLEPQSVAARDAFIKWQVRLRSMALACPHDDSTSVWVFPLLRDLADEICSLAGRGPGRREVIITGDEALTLDVQTAAPFSLLIGELMRLVLGTRQHGPGPELYVNLRPHPGGGFQLTVRSGVHRSFIFIDRDSEVETLELLTEQIQGRLEPTDPGNPAKEWVLIVPQTRF